MSQNKVFKIGPVAMSATLTTNILNGAVTSLAGPVGLVITQPVIYVKRIHVTSKSASAATFSLWIGATGGNAAGTEFFSAQNVAANSSFDWTSGPGLQLLSTDFLVGGCVTGAGLLVIEMEVEAGLS